MAQLNQLLNQLPQGGDIHITTVGQILWLSWQGRLPQAVNQTLLNYGGMLVGESNDQAIWFFFTNDVFLALARLRVWGNLNPLPVTIELFSGRLQLTNKRQASLAIDGILSSQEIFPREMLDIYIHPTSREAASFMPGITFERAALRQGMAAAEWQMPVVDNRLPYDSTQSWFLVLHPLGNPLDKKFQSGWSAMFARLEELFQELKIRFIMQDGFVIVGMDNLLMMRTFLRDYLQTFDREKQEGGAYWPTVCVVSDRKGLNFNAELPKRIGLKWDSLMPDFPYLSYRNAFLLGEGFVIRDLRFSGGQSTIDSWCNTMLDENSISARSIPLIMSAQLAGSAEHSECFYCGLPNHAPAECPTRAYFPSRSETWQQIACMDLDGINAAFKKIELTLTAGGGRGYDKLLDKEDDASALLQAIFDICGSGQLRNVPRNWLYRLREPDPDEEAPVKDDSPAWSLLEKFVQTPPENLVSLDKEIVQAITRVQRDPRLRMLRAFLHIERNDPATAMAMFKEAAAITPSPALQAWNEFLQGRLLESQGKYADASAMYSQVLRVMPQWREVTYRSIVCRVKMGFAEQILDRVVQLVRQEPEYFNRFLIDPALERGRLLILSSLHDMWEESRKNAEAEKDAVAAVSQRLHDWFPEDHPVQARLGQKIDQMTAQGSVDNYMAYFVMSRSRPQLEKDINDSIQREVDELRNRYKAYLDVLEEIRDEASWFPFPSALKDFSSDFNRSAGIINWAFGSNFGEPATFKKAQSSMPELDGLLQNLKKRLKFLRSVRDGTLFVMTMFRTFIWIEIVGLLLCFLGVPAL
ncbi:MAG: hypothetical protein HDQ44_02000, partial [Desulfovibrio sp.]|nr:hypothetical protein [Desulfovibrio sp.]